MKFSPHNMDAKELHSCILRACSDLVRRDITPQFAAAKDLFEWGLKNHYSPTKDDAEVTFTEWNDMRILFICTGNTCRSPMAEGYFKSLVSKHGATDIEVSSAGTFAGDGEPASPNSVRAMREIGIDISDHRSAPLTREMIDCADLIVAMTESHRMRVGALNPSALAKTKLLSEYAGSEKGVSDPFGGGMGVYNACLDSMIQALNSLYEIVSKKSVDG